MTTEPLTLADLERAVEAFRLPPLPEDATEGDRALRAMVETGEARLASSTITELRELADMTPGMTGAWTQFGIVLIIDETVPHLCVRAGGFTWCAR